MYRLRPLAFLLLALFLTAGAKKQPAVSVRFHLEANKQDTNSFSAPIQLLSPQRPAYLEKIPAISERDVLAIYPFPASDGTLGCAFRLDDHGSIGLDALSVERRGSLLVAFINGRQVVDLLIDKRISDGIVVIPNGLAPQEIAALKKTFRVMGGEKKPASPTPAPNPQSLKAEN